MARGFTKKRGDIWYAYWRDQGGKQRSKAVSPRKKDADAFLVQMQREVNENVYRDIKKISFSEFADVWYSDYASVHLKPSTRYSNNLLVRNSFLPFFGDVRLTAITTADIQRYVAARNAEGKAPSTIKRALAVLKAMFNWAVEVGYLKQNPAEKCKAPKAKLIEMDFLSPAEIRIFLDAVPNEWKPFFHTAIFTGMRTGEIIGLRWSDIDWHNHAIMVRRSVWNNEFQDPKSYDSARAIGMSPSLEKTLKDYREVARESEFDLVFCNEVGKPLDVNNVRNRVFNKALAEAGLRRIRLHDLRHTFASLLIHQGENLKYVQQQLGHASITTTVNRYGHLMPDVRENASMKLDATVFAA